MNWVLPCFWCFFLPLIYGYEPVWNIAHMVNTLEEVDEYIQNGANAIEIDVEFNSKTGEPSRIYHGFPCDKGRDCFKSNTIENHIQGIKERGTKGSPNFKSQLTLVLFDCKVTNLSSDQLKTSGQKLFSKIQSLVDSSLYMIISVPKIKHVSFLTGFKEELNTKNAKAASKIGFDISLEAFTSMSKIKQAYDKVNIKSNIWVSSGITNWIPKFGFNMKKLVNAWKGNDSFASGASGWTVDDRKTIRKWLNIGIRGIITNKPSKVVEIVNEMENLKLATKDNYPFPKEEKEPQYTEGLYKWFSEFLIQMDKSLREWNRRDFFETGAYGPTGNDTKTIHKLLETETGDILADKPPIETMNPKRHLRFGNIN